MHMTRHPACSPRLVVRVVLALVILRVGIAYFSTDAFVSDVSSLHAPWAARTNTTGDVAPDLARTANRTLGFEKVVAISLPERSDKRDALDLMASLTGFDIDWEDGVKASSIVEKAVPHGIGLERAKENFLGSWRGHMNAIRRIVETGASSALILEDDVDWDVHVKSQLANIARGVRHVLGSPEPEAAAAPGSPYGDDWDVLWLGHCGEVFPEMLEENRGLDEGAKAAISTKYAIKDDETMPPYSRVPQWVPWSAFAPHTRLVHLSGLPVCSFAYAVSQRAARKMLHAMSVDGLKTEFDNALAGLCRDRQSEGSYQLRCVSVNPAIMFHHKPKGRLAGDSDINNQGEDGAEREQGFTESIKWSMRLNLRNVLLGKPLEAQFEG